MATDPIKAKLNLENAVIEFGKASHAVEDSTSPSHAGFQPWYGFVDGPVQLGPEIYGAFLLAHHEQENADAYAKLHDGPADAVAAEMHDKLLVLLSP